jgi:hypothetical protein
LPGKARGERVHWAFLSRAEELTQTMIRELRSYEKAERAHSEADYLVSIAARLQLEARLKWLRMVPRVTGSASRRRRTHAAP